MHDSDSGIGINSGIVALLTGIGIRIRIKHMLYLIGIGSRWKYWMIPYVNEISLQVNMDNLPNITKSI